MSESKTPRTDAAVDMCFPWTLPKGHEALEKFRQLVTEMKNLERALAAKTAECERLGEDLNWLEKKLFSRKWMPPLGSPHFWELVGHWRHVIQKMKGETFRNAIDAARKETP